MRTFLHTLTIFAAVLVLLGALPNSAMAQCGSVPGNLVTNCGFEAGQVGTSPGGGSTTGWTIVNPQSGYESLVGSPVHTGYNSFRLGNFNYQEAGGIEQTISDSSKSYTLAFYVNNDAGPDGPGTVNFQAYFNGVSLLDLSQIPAQPFTEYSYTVTGTGSDTIEFLAINNVGDFFLDDVSLSPKGGVTPEPATFVLFGTGLLGIAFIMRKRLA